MAIEGALQDVSLADICQLLGMGRKTGCLSITDRSNFGYIYFQKGRVIHASVLNRRDRLGELLVRNQVITREDLSSAIERQRHGKGMRLGQILLEMGAIEREELRRYIQMQVEEAVYHLFAWQTGSFHFDTDQMPDEDGLLLVDISPEALLMEGARRVDEWSLIEKKVPSFDIVFQVDVDPSTSEGEVELTREQRKILPFIDGERTAHEIMNEAGLVEFETGKALYGLIQAGFVSRAGERSTDAETGGDETLQHRLNVAIAFYRSGMLDDAQREFEDLLSVDPHQARANFMMGLIAFRRGLLEDAVAHFRSMPSGYADGYAVHRNTALALEALGRYDEALEELRAAGAARPKDHELYLARGVVHFKAGQIEEALEAFRRYRTYPGLKVPSELYYTYAVLAVGMAGSLDAAIAIGQEGMGHHPKSGAILVNVGNILERRGDADAAVALYERAAALTPPLAQAHKSLGDHAYARGDMEVARVHYEKAVKLAPRLGDDVYLRLGSMAHEANDRDVALLLWRRALELNPRNEAARSHIELLQAE